jgi:hypothetical protein
MIDNTPDSEDTRYLMTASNTFRRLSKDIENMSVEEIAEFTAAVGREVDTFSKLHPNMDQLAGWSNIFGLGPELAALSELSAEERKKRLAEIAKEDAVTAALLNFELALNNVKTFILDQFLALGPDISALATELFDLTGVSDEAGSTFEALKNYARDLIADGFALLKVEIQEFTDYLKAGGDPVEYLKEGLKNVASAVYDWFKELFFGASKEIDTPAGKKTVDDLTKPGLVANMVNAFNNFWEGPYGQAIADTVTGYFKVLLDKMQDMLADWIPGLDKSQSYYEDIQTRYEAGTATPEEREELAARIQREDAQRVADDVNASIVEGLGPILGTIYEYTPLTETSQYYGARMGQGISNWWNETSPEDIIERGYATGTSGFEDFGRESAAKLHGVEAVVPRNTQAGDFLSKYFTDDWRAKAQPAQPVATNNNQEAVTKQLSQLNNTMALVLSELKINNDLNKKTISSVKGLSGDLYRGV